METLGHDLAASSILTPSTRALPGWKRALDLACIVLLAPALVPLMLLIAAVIKLVSKGPVIFRQERIGFRGRPFTCFKFRTMKVNADTGVHERHLDTLIQSDVPMEKLDSCGDDRLIRFGHLLRSSGLDELPQLYNVWRGEMSIVGPRPCLRYEYEKYLPWHHDRLKALPGLTGLWQVSGKNRTTFTEMMQLDIQYATRPSLWLDLTIILKTGFVLLEQCSRALRFRRGPAAAPGAPPSTNLQPAPGRLPCGVE